MTGTNTTAPLSLNVLVDCSSDILLSMDFVKGKEQKRIIHSDTSRAFPKPKSGRIALKVINHLGDEVMKVFKV